MAAVFALLVGIAMFTDDSLVLSLVAIGYWVFLSSRVWGGQTVGMRILQIRVVGADGRPLSLGGAAIRYIGLVVATLALGIGLLAIVWDPDRQGWHDKMAKSYVVKA